MFLIEQTNITPKKKKCNGDRTSWFKIESHYNCVKKKPKLKALQIQKTNFKIGLEIS